VGKIQIILLCLMVLSGAGNIFLLSGCKSFEVVTVKGEPSECNDFYTAMKYYSVQEKDSAFVGTVYTECKIARSAIRLQTREKHCKELIYGTDSLDKTNYKKYSEYQDCSKQ